MCGELFLFADEHPVACRQLRPDSDFLCYGPNLKLPVGPQFLTNGVYAIQCKGVGYNLIIIPL
jgi:hypothetical protein